MTRQPNIAEAIALLESLEQKIPLLENDPHMILEEFFIGFQGFESYAISNFLRQVNLNGYHIDNLFTDTLDRIPEFTGMRVQKKDVGRFTLSAGFDSCYSTVLDINAVDKTYVCKINNAIERWQEHLSYCHYSEPELPDAYEVINAVAEKPSIGSRYRMARFYFKRVQNKRRLLRKLYVFCLNFCVSRKIAIDVRDRYLADYQNHKEWMEKSNARAAELKVQYPAAEESLRLQVMNIIAMLTHLGYSDVKEKP